MGAPISINGFTLFLGKMSLRSALPNDVFLRVVRTLDLDVRIRAGIVRKLSVPERVRRALGGVLQKPTVGPGSYTRVCLGFLGGRGGLYPFYVLTKWNDGSGFQVSRYSLINSTIHIAVVGLSQV